MKAALCVGLFLTFPPMMIPGELPLLAPFAVTTGPATMAASSPTLGPGTYAECAQRVRSPVQTVNFCCSVVLAVYEILERSLSKKVCLSACHAP